MQVKQVFWIAVLPLGLALKTGCIDVGYLLCVFVLLKKSKGLKKKYCSLINVCYAIFAGGSGAYRQPTPYRSDP